MASTVDVCDVVSGPLELLDALEQGHRHVVILDLDQPNLEALRLIERLVRRRPAVTALVTGSTLTPGQCAALERAGAAAVIVKEFGAGLRFKAWLTRVGAHLGASASNDPISATTASARAAAAKSGAHKQVSAGAARRPSEPSQAQPLVADPPTVVWARTTAEPDALDERVAALRAAGDAAGAAKLLEQIVSETDDLAVVRKRNKQLLSLYVEDLGDAERAIDLCRRWRKRDANNADLARVLNQLLTRLGRAEAANPKEDQSRRLAHDLQEPARSIRNYLRILMRRYGEQLDDDGASLVQRAMDSSERMMARVAGTVIGGARGSGHFDAAEVAQSAVDDLDRLIAERGAEVSVGELPALSGQADDFRRVIQNLVSNAVVHGPIRGVKITVSGSNNGGRLVIEVNDDGPGSASLAGATVSACHSTRAGRQLRRRA